MDKCKTGLGYNAIPPPYTGNFMPLKSDLVYPSLDDFVDVNESIVEKPTVETNEPETARKENGAPIIKDWESDSDEENVPKVKTVEMFNKPSFAKINFVKSTEQGNPHQDLKDKRVIDSGCSRYMTGNRSYLTDYEEINRGFIAFGGNSKGGKITRKGIENLIDLGVKVMRCDNRTEFKNRTLIEATRTMLADSKLPTTFWAEAVNTACYVQNRVLVIKPHNKTPYELFLGRKPALSFMRPFGCPVTILNTIDHLGKFDGKADERFFVRYSTNSKAFRVFNSRTRIVEENLHVQFSENTSNIAGSGPNWLFDIDALTNSMNYKLVVVGNQSNGNAGTKACNDADSKSSPDAGFKPSGEEEKKDAKDPGNEDSEVPSTEEPRVYQEKDDNVSSTNNVNTASNTINTVSPTVNAASIEVNVVDLKSSIKLPDDLNMPELEDIVYSDDDEDVGAEADMNNLDAFMPISPILTTRIHKDHPFEQIIGDLHSTPQTRRMTKNLEEHEEPKKVIHTLKDPSWIEAIQDELLQFKLQKVWTLVDLPNGKKAIGTKCVYKNKKDERGIVIKNKARLVAQGYTQEEGIDYDEVFAPVSRIKAIRLFLAYALFKDFVVYQMDVKSAFIYGKIEEEVYVCQPPGFEDPDFPNRKGVKGDIFLVQVYVDDIIFGSTKKSLSTEFEKMMHKKFQMSSMGELTFFLGLQVKQKEDGIFINQDKPDIMFAVCACARFQVNPKSSHLHAVKRIFRYLKGQPKLGLWYPKDSPFDLVAYTNSDYAEASVDRKSTIGGALDPNQLLDYGYNFMQTKIHIDNESTIYIVKNPVFHSKTKHIEIRHHFIRDSYEKKLIQMIKIHTDQNVADLLTKAFDVSRFQYLIASIGMLNL
ncbi:putative ribonuclease H-like domain-containing protein [Tanacetum coccineum]